MNLKLSFSSNNSVLFCNCIRILLTSCLTGQQVEQYNGYIIELYLQISYTYLILYTLSYADDIALISQDIEQAQELLSNVETQALKLGLKINSRKTEIMAFSQSEPINIHSLLNEDIKVVNNFKYLGAWMSSSSKDFEIRKALAWQACHKLKKLWNSKLKRKLKIRTFQATIESILLYGSETWTIDKSLERRINGCYTRLL